MQRIDRRYGKVTPFDAGPMADVDALALRIRIPGGFRGIDLVRRRMHVVDIPDVVENEEFVLGSEKSLISDTRGLEVFLGTPRRHSRTAVVALHRGRLIDVAADIHGRIVGKDIEYADSASGMRIMSDS